MKEQLFDEIGIAYAQNGNKYPDFLAMNDDTYRHIMQVGEVPAGFDYRSLNWEKQTILGLKVLLDNDIKGGEVKLLYCKKTVK